MRGISGTKWWHGLALVILGVLSADRLRADTAYFEDFSSGSANPAWSGTNLAVSHAAAGTTNAWYLGLLNNDTVTLSLTGLNLGGGPATPNTQGQHTFTTVSYDVFIIGGWLGNNDATLPASPNTFMSNFSSSADAVSNLLTTTFSNDAGTLQTYPYDSGGGFYSQPGGKSANQINTLGFTGNDPSYNDSIYSMSGGRNQAFTFSHTVDDLALTFSAQNLTLNANWGLTNVKVVTGGIFTWQSIPGEGLNGGWDFNPHWLNPNGTSTNIPGADDAVVFSAVGNYFVSIHHNYSAGYLRVTGSSSSTAGVMFNTIGHALTLTAGDYANASLAVADGPGLIGSLFVLNSYDDLDSNFNGVINAQTVGIARGVNAQGTLTLDGNLDVNYPGAGNVILNVQRELTVGDARANVGGPVGVATLNILHGAVVNSGLGGGSASNNPADGNPVGFAAYVDGAVTVDDHSIWNQTGFIWIGVSGPGSLTVSHGSQVNVFQLPFVGQPPATTGTLSIGGFAGSNGVVTVTDPGSQINAGFVQVGTIGIGATLTIDNFALFTATYVSIGSYITAFSGPSGSALVNLSHQGQIRVTTPDGMGQLNVGDYFNGTLTLGYLPASTPYNVGLATVDSAIIGNGPITPGVNDHGPIVYGEVDVLWAQAAGLHSLFTVNKTLTVGAAGNGHGVLFMSAGGVAIVLGQGTAPGTIVTVGDQAGSWGQVFAGGGSGGAGWAQGSTFDASAGGVVLGNAGYGRLDLAVGGEAFAKTVVMAQQVGSSADMVIDGDLFDQNHATFLKVSAASAGLTVGQAGNSAAIVVTHGGLLDTYRATVGGQGNNMSAGTVTLQNAGSLWLVHGQALGSFFTGGKLDVGGDGLGGLGGGSGVVTVGAGSQLGVEVSLQLARNGMVVLNGGAITVGTADPLLLDSTPNRLHIMGNTTLNLAYSTVYGQGTIEGDVLLDNGGYLGPNGFVGGQTGTLTIVGTYHELAGGTLSVKLEAPGPGHYDTVAVLGSLIDHASGNAIFDNGAGVTVIGEAYTTPQFGDYFDLLTAANVDLVGSLNLQFAGSLSPANWYYGVVSVPGGEALRIEYGTSVPEPAALSLLGIGLLGLLARRRQQVPRR